MRCFHSNLSPDLESLSLDTAVVAIPLLPHHLQVSTRRLAAGGDLHRRFAQTQRSMMSNLCNSTMWGMVLATKFSGHWIAADSRRLEMSFKTTRKSRISVRTVRFALYIPFCFEFPESLCQDAFKKFQTQTRVAAAQRWEANRCAGGRKTQKSVI